MLPKELAGFVAFTDSEGGKIWIRPESIILVAKVGDLIVLELEARDEAIALAKDQGKRLAEALRVLWQSRNGQAVDALIERKASAMRRRG